MTSKTEPRQTSKFLKACKKIGRSFAKTPFTPPLHTHLQTDLQSASNKVSATNARMVGDEGAAEWEVETLDCFLAFEEDVVLGILEELQGEVAGG